MIHGQVTHILYDWNHPHCVDLVDRTQYAMGQLHGYDERQCTKWNYPVVRHRYNRGKQVWFRNYDEQSGYITLEGAGDSSDRASEYLSFACNWDSSAESRPYQCCYGTGEAPANWPTYKGGDDWEVLWCPDGSRARAIWPPMKYPGPPGVITEQ